MGTSSDQQRIFRLEQRVAYLYQHLGLDPADAEAASAALLPPSFYEALRARNLIAAIKIYRDTTGAGLAEAKREVEAIARRRTY